MKSMRIVYRQCRYYSVNRPTSTLNSIKDAPDIEKCPFENVSKKTNKNPITSNLKSFSSIPGPASYPEFGTNWEYHQGFKDVIDLHDHLYGMYEEFGPVVREVQATLTVIHLFDPKDCEIVYNSTTLPYVQPLLQTAKDYSEQHNSGIGLGGINGDYWHKMRRFVNKHTLRPDAAAEYIPTKDMAAKKAINMLSEEFLRDDGAVDDIEKLVDRWIFESMFTVATGDSYYNFFDERSSNGDDIATKYASLNRAIMELSAYKKYAPKSNKFAQLEDFQQQFYGKYDDICRSVIADKTKQLTASGCLDDDSLIYKMIRDNNEIIPAKDMESILLSLITDGLSTTSPTLINGLHLLALNPDVQEELFEEISVTCPTSQGILNRDNLSNSPKIRSFLKETLRICPIGEAIQRFLTCDLTLGGYKIPNGTAVDMNPFIWTRSPEVFPDPEKVILNRWNREDKQGITDKFHPMMNTPFSHGVRMCIGRRMAEHDISLFIIRLLQQYKVSLSHHQTPKMKYAILLYPKLPIPFVFTKR